MANSFGRCSKYFGAAALAAACSAPQPASRPAASAEDRAALGLPAVYPQEAPAVDLRENAAKRREFGWSVARRVVAATGIAGGHYLPRWRTWYDRIDLTRLFERGMLTIGKAARHARVPFAPEQLDELEGWNLVQRPPAPVDDAHATGLGGVTRTLYDGAAARHILANYGALAACRKQILVEPTSPELEPADAANFAPCLPAEFPPGAALVKTAWRRAGEPLPVFDTGAAALAALLAEASPTWRPARTVPGAAPGTIFRAQGAHAAFDLVGLHIMTKELRHWVWVSLWWAPDGGADFGADRPADWDALAPEWKGYKMCVAVDFDGPDGASWCSNPYLEDGPGQAASNCIGCHQHSGSGLTGPAAARIAGRRQARKNFPYDYVWSLATEPDFIAARMQESLDYYDAVDP